MSMKPTEVSEIDRLQEIISKHMLAMADELSSSFEMMTIGCIGRPSIDSVTAALHAAYWCQYYEEELPLKVSVLVQQIQKLWR